MLNKKSISLSHKFSALLFAAVILAYVFSAGFLGMKAAAADNNSPSVEAVSALLIDARRGQVIFSKSSDESIKNPVVNRIMTALIALDALDKTGSDAMVTASNEAIGVEGASLELTVGEKYPVKNMVYALLLTGANDAAKAIADYVGGGEPGFVGLMNDYAAKIGMANTNFTNSTGLFDENQYTTADDMALLIRYAMTNSTEFNKVFSTQAKPWYDTVKTIVLTNSNNMFWDYGDTDGGALGGFDPALQTIITTATQNSMRLICILADVPSEKSCPDSTTLLTYGFDNYRYGTLVAAGSVQKTVDVEGESVNLVPTVDVHYIYPRGQNYIKKVDINVDQTKLKPPVTTNSIVGIMTFTLLDDTIINVELYPDKEILPKKTQVQILKERISENMGLIYVIAGLLVLEVILLMTKAIGALRKSRIGRRIRKLHHHR